MSVKHDVIVAGVPLPPGSLQPTPSPRRPIEELITDKKQWSLYVQAMAMMMEGKAADMLSWFAVAGIHGAPQVPWDQVVGIAQPGWMGYCTHASVLFPTWHRAYVLLFEQALVGCAIKLAADYKGADADAWVKAAQGLRSPYWDWARNSVPPKEVIELKTLRITKATGEADVENPLLGYRFKSTEPRVDTRPTTVRCAKPGSPNETSLPDLVKSLKVLDNPNDPMRDRVYNTINDANSWETFSNRRTSQGAFRNSLETIHDLIHVLVGGNGTMADARVAAFDPIFWLHHTNVDRLISLWQAIHPDVWVSAVTGPGEGGTFTMARNARINADTDLTPFWNGEKTFFKSSSAGIRQWEKINYTYPEFQNLQGGSSAQTRAAILATVKHLYQDDAEEEKSAPAVPAEGTGFTVGKKVSAPPLHVASGLMQQAFALGGPAHGQPSTLANAPQTHTGRVDWFIRIRTKAASLGSSFTVLVFLGAPPASEADWRTADNLVGVHIEFVNSDPDRCSNCLVNADIVTEGFVELTRALKAHGMYTHPEADIERYLSENLQWRVQKIDATIVDPSEVAGLEVAVLTVPLEFSEERGGWKKPQDVRPTHRNVTSGRPGGRALPQ